MSSGTTGGMNFGLHNGVVDFFGEKGQVLGDGTWMINLHRGHAPIAAVPSESLVPGIVDLIRQDIANGNRHRVAMALVGPRQAMVLFMEGVITAQHLAHATEPANVVDVPNVRFGDWTLTVRVMDDPTLRFATADANGQII